MFQSPLEISLLHNGWNHGCQDNAHVMCTGKILNAFGRGDVSTQLTEIIDYAGDEQERCGFKYCPYKRTRRLDAPDLGVRIGH